MYEYEFADTAESLAKEAAERAARVGSEEAMEALRNDIDGARAEVQMGCGHLKALYHDHLYWQALPSLFLPNEPRLS